MANRKRRATGHRTAPSRDGGAVGRAIHSTISGGEAVSVGVVNLVKNTLAAAVSGVQDVGKEVGATAVAAARGSIRAANDIGGDLLAVAERAVKGTVRAAGEIRHELIGSGDRKPGATVPGRRPLARVGARTVRHTPREGARRRSA